MSRVISGILSSSGLRHAVSTIGLAAILVTCPAITADASASTTSVPYYLPWTAGTSWHVSQGTNTGSHTGDQTWAYDFDMNDGQDVLASAPGTIISVERNVTGRVSSDQDPQANGNNVKIQHADGKCTRYLHMAHGSVTSRNQGDEIAQGEILGKVGNTGYTVGMTGIHLHWQRDDCHGHSIETGFVESSGATLQQDQSYASQNSPIPQLPAGDLIEYFKSNADPWVSFDHTAGTSRAPMQPGLAATTVGTTIEVFGVNSAGELINYHKEPGQDSDLRK